MMSLSQDCLSLSASPIRTETGTRAPSCPPESWASNSKNLPPVPPQNPSGSGGLPYRSDWKQTHAYLLSNTPHSPRSARGLLLSRRRKVMQLSCGQSGAPPGFAAFARRPCTSPARGVPPQGTSSKRARVRPKLLCFSKSNYGVSLVRPEVKRFRTLRSVGLAPVGVYRWPRRTSLVRLQFDGSGGKSNVVTVGHE